MATAEEAEQAAASAIRLIAAAERLIDGLSLFA